MGLICLYCYLGEKWKDQVRNIRKNNEVFIFPNAKKSSYYFTPSYSETFLLSRIM